MTLLSHALALNIASLALFVWLWTRLDYRLGWAPRWARDGVMGLVMGLAGVASMYSSTEVAPGILFDLRSVPVVLAGYVAGPLGGLLAGGLSAGYRYGLGGIGAEPALLGIGFAALVGSFGYLFKGLAPTAVDAAILSVATALLPYLTTALVVAQGHQPHWAEILPLAIARGAGMFVTVSIVIHDMRQSREQLLLRTAIAQVPDYFYVKDKELRHVAVNQLVAEHHHLVTPDRVVGKTDHDLEPVHRADQIASREIGLLATPSTPLHELELIKGDDGVERWFDTTKVALRAASGEVIGLVGVTRDVTKSRELERELAEGRDLFGLVLEEMPTGVALFDRHGVLRYSNARYRSAFPLTGHLRVPGTHIRDILAGVVESGEQLGIMADGAARWIDDVTGALATANDQEIPLFDGTWMHLRTHPIANGSSLVVVSDVTSIKGSEKALLQMTDQLAKIATVDAMTGVLTRRAFDGKLRAAVRVSEVKREAISLLMIDVDHFKRYNDTYGHMAGDVCLGRVAHALAASVRAGDIVGRYGGEEFVAVLPEASQEAALEVADRVIQRLAEAAEPHSGSPTGLVTVSIGVAAYESDTSGRTHGDLIARADGALYRSKADGRARVTLWEADPLELEWSATAS